MKKLVFVLLSLFVLAAPAFAASVEVRPEVVARMYDDADQALGAGVNVDLKDVMDVPVVFLGGLELIGTEADGSAADLTVVTSKLGLGYDYALNDGTIVRPYATIDFAFVNGEDSKSDNEVGRSLGVNLSHAVSERTSLFLGAGFQWLETHVGGSEVSLDNFNLRSGISVKF